MKILAFGIAKEILGGMSVDMIVADGITAGMLKTEIQERYPGLKKLSSFMIAVNGEYAMGDRIISIADEVAIIPPVSGG